MIEYFITWSPLAEKTYLKTPAFVCQEILLNRFSTLKTHAIT